MSEFVIETDNLTRYFGRKAAVRQVNVAVPKGGVFALMGRNGSGKTTMIRMLLGLLSPTRGSAKILGTDSARLTPEIRASIGYMSEGHFVYNWMRVADCARFQAGCFPRWNQKVFDGVVDHFGLDARAKAGTLARGERAGLCLAMTLAPEPELLVLDDPALGLDPVARRALVEAMLVVTNRRDRTILLSSHYLDDVERVADHLAILDRGILRVHCPVEEFRQKLGRWVLHFAERPREIPRIPGLVHSQIYEKEMQLTVANPPNDLETTLSQTGAVTVDRVSLSLDQAVIDYLTDRGRSGSLLEAVGAPPDEIEPTPATAEST